MHFLLPELTVIITAFVLLFVDLFIQERRRVILAPLALVGLGLAGLFTVFILPQTGSMWGGRFGVDAVSEWFKLLFLLSAFITVALSMDLMDGRTALQAQTKGPGSRGEYYTVLLFTVVGMMFLASARDLITLYVSLELATIPLFALTVWKRDAQAGEAGLKYVVIGALASALFLYGLGLLYGLTGETSLVAIGRSIIPSPAFWLAMALMMAGVGFKLTLVPFHLWAADVYEGAPTPITAYLSVASKGAGLALMFQIFFQVAGRFLGEMNLALAILAALTMTLGNLAAIVQKNIKRFMAFSAISQAGYLLMGFIGPSGLGVTAMLFYLMVYVFTNLAVFAVIIFYSNETGREEIKDYRGLSRLHPLMALSLMIALFGLAGIPPLSGFVGKFFLFSVASKAGFHWLVAVAAINSTVSLYYYLRIIRQMYIEPLPEGTKPLTVRPILGTTLAFTTLASVILGILPFFYETLHHHTVNWLLAVIR